MSHSVQSEPKCVKTSHWQISLFTSCTGRDLARLTQHAAKNPVFSFLPLTRSFSASFLLASFFSFFPPNYLHFISLTLAAAKSTWPWGREKRKIKQPCPCKKKKKRKEKNKNEGQKKKTDKLITTRNRWGSCISRIKQDIRNKNKSGVCQVMSSYFVGPLLNIYS